MTTENNLVSQLNSEEQTLQRHQLNCISPDDAKYAPTTNVLSDYLSAAAEWRMCAYVQQVLLETRAAFGKATQTNVEEVRTAMKQIDPLNMALLEQNVTKHDQLAVIEEIGRFVSKETKALLHPGTTSYDIVDTARTYLIQNAWIDIIRPQIITVLQKLYNLSERSLGVLQVGRTHLQDTSPVLFGAIIAGYAARIAERTTKCDAYIQDLRGKISGIVGTGASIDMVIGTGTSIEFEKEVLKRLGIKPDYTATQIVQKERLADVGHGLTTLTRVLADFANDIRLLYSTAINEVTSRDNAERLGGSSADATKNNPINYENIAGTATIVESGMRILYELIQTNLQRDLRGSKQARYQPQAMMAQTYETMKRTSKVLEQLSLNTDTIEENLKQVRKNPGEAMVAILRGEQWVHPTKGNGHEFVKTIAKQAKKERKPLLTIALKDETFTKLYDKLPLTKQEILNGALEQYTGTSAIRTQKNLKYVQDTINK